MLTHLERQRLWGLYFGDLTGLPDDAEAKVLLMNYHDAVASVPFPAGAVDVDRAIDYAQWQKGRE